MELYLRNTPNDYTYKNAYLEQNSSKIETLILGSSHSYYGLNPLYFSKNTFNASHISQTLDYDYELLMKYKDHFKTLKRIYIPMSYFSLWERLKAEGGSWRCKNYAMYYNIDTSGKLKHRSEVLSLPFHKNITRVVSSLFSENGEISCTELGWGLGYDSEKQRDLVLTGKLAVDGNTFEIENPKYQRTLNESIFLLNEMINWSKENKIKVVLFTPPAYKTYRQNSDKKQMDATINISTEIAKNHTNCRYYNFIDDASFVSQDFFDADHLSELGAEKLSKKLKIMESLF